MFVKYSKRQLNISKCSISGPPKFTQIGIFGLKINHLAALENNLPVRRRRKKENNNIGKKAEYFIPHAESLKPKHEISLIENCLSLSGSGIGRLRVSKRERERERERERARARARAREREREREKKEREREREREREIASHGIGSQLRLHHHLVSKAQPSKAN
jgi:hypothetical protein